MAARLTPSDSKFIAAIRITMIAGLIVHHLFAIPGSGFFPRASLNSEVLNLANVLNSLLHWGTMAAVPLLSLLSGYLYFARTKVDHQELLAKRIHTIILPSLAWTSLWFVFGVGVSSLARPYDALQWLSYGTGPLDWLDVLNGVIGITEEPLAYQFWFVHDLALTLALVPVLTWLLRRAGPLFLLLLTALWFADAIPPPFFMGNVLYFFCIGAFLAMHSVSLTGLAQTAQHWQISALVAFTLLLAGRMFSDVHSVFASHVWLCLLRLAGVVAMGLFIAARLQRPDSWLNAIGRFSPYAFFIFATHYPLIEFIKVIFERIPLQQTGVGQVLSLLLIPALTLLACLWAAKLLQKYLPRVFAFANGGREAQVASEHTQTEHRTAPALRGPAAKKGP